MAEPSRVVNVTPDVADPPWSTVADVSRGIDPEEWVLVGGLMVEVHTRAAGLVRNRATGDMDIVVNVVAGRTSAQQVWGALTRMGFEIQRPSGNGPAHRLVRGAGEVVDLMVPENLPTELRQRLFQRAAFAPPGAAQAVARRQQWTLVTDSARSTIYVPSLTGAIVAKAIAFGVDQRDRDRHIEDCVALLAIATDDDLRAFEEITASERRRIRVVRDRLVDPTDSAWLDVNAEAGRHGLAALQRLASTARL